MCTIRIMSLFGFTNMIETTTQNEPVILEDPRIDPKLHPYYLDDIRVQYKNTTAIYPQTNSSNIKLHIKHFDQASHYNHFFYDQSHPPMIDFDSCIVCKTNMIAASALANNKGETFLTLGLCPHCGFLQHIKRPPREWYQNFYRTFWDPDSKEEKGPSILNVTKSLFERVEYLLKPESKILEIGSGFGKSIMAFHIKGYKTLATEATQHRSDYIRSLGIPCFTGEAENIPTNMPGFEAGTFDGIMSTNVLEHVYDTRAVLEHTYQFLKPGGWAYLEVPNYYQENLTLNTHGTSHTCNFSHANFLYLLESIGYELVKDFSTNDYISILAVKNPAMKERAHLRLANCILPYRGLAYIFEKSGLSRLPLEHPSDIEMELAWYLMMGEHAIPFFRFQIDIQKNQLPLIEEIKQIIRKRKPLELASHLLPLTYVYDSDTVPIWYY